MISCPTCGTSYPASVRLCPRDGTVLEGHKPAEERFVGAVLHGKYRLDSFLSSGGMGSVFRATHVMLGKPVAVKLIKADLVGSSDAVRRFQREARAATSLNHPSIVSVYDLGQTDDGTLYIAMELVEGKSLKDEMRENGRIDAARIAYILRQVANALGLAHRHHIIHRDLKPQNVMLTRDSDDREIAKVLDFGIAKTFEDANTQRTATGFVLGTPQYMSPEQTMGKKVDARSDIYALGVMLYEMLIGEVPFNDPSTPAVLVKHMTEVPAPPSRRRPDVPVPPHLEAVALKCLEKDPANRYQSMDEFAAALESDAGFAATVLVSNRSRAASPILEPPLESSAPQGVSGTRPTWRTPLQQPPMPDGRRKSRMAPGLALVLLSAGAGGWFVLSIGDKPGAVQRQPQAAPDASPATGLRATPQEPSSTVETAPSAAKNASPASVGSGSEGEAPSEREAAPPPLTPPPPPVASARGASGVGAARPTGSATLPPATNPAAQAASAVARSTSPAVSQSAAEPNLSPTPTTLPKNPAVFAQCEGPSEICGAVRPAFDQALQSQNLPIARSAQRAQIIIIAEVTALGEQKQESFGTEFSIRNYSIEVKGDARAVDEVIPMPSARNLSFDPRYGSERVQESARVVAIEAVRRVREFLRGR